MIFSSLQYLIFLPIAVCLYWRTTGGARLALVVVASYIFYMSWLPTYGILLFLLTSANWLLGQAIDRNRGRSPALGKWLLGGGLCLNLGCLVYFKYTNFFLANIASAWNSTRAVGDWLASAPSLDFPTLNILLPLGISFFVFEFVHYLVDIYRGDKAIKSWWEFAAFAAFFPSQIAGPIKRYQDFTAQLRQPKPLTGGLFNEGVSLIVQGLFKKVAIADPLGTVVYNGFTANQALSCADATIASLAFVIQVFCDFSGYTDIGRGSALLMGIRLPENFQLPYLSHDLADFWRRWHMSLSYWLRDYVYIPLGGSKLGRLANWRNLFVTMAACGLWHGADWHYVIFGCVQGIGLIVNREWRHCLSRLKSLEAVLESAAGRWLGTAITFTFLTFSFTLFRAPDMSHAFNVWSGFSHLSWESTLWTPVVKSGVLVFLAVYAGFWLVNEYVKRCAGDSLKTGSHFGSGRLAPVRVAAWTAAMIIMVAARPTEATPFMYFQF